MVAKVHPVGKIDANAAKAIELYDPAEYDFFRPNTVGKGYSVYVDPASFLKDPKRQMSFVRFAETFQAEIAKLPPSNKLARAASTKVGDILLGVKQDIVQFEIPIRQGRFAQLDAFDSKDYELFEDTGRVTLDGESLVLARIRFDLSHYLNIADYRKAVDHFTQKAGSVYSQALTQRGQTLEEIDPDLANLVRFCSFPDIHFDLALREKSFSEITTQSDPNGTFLTRAGTMNLPKDPATYVRARLTIRASDLKSDPAKRALLHTFAIGVLGYYDGKLAARDQRVEELEVDMRNFYRILYAYKSFPASGELTGDVMVSQPAIDAELEEAFKGATTGVADPAATQGLPARQAPAAGQVASATITAPTTSPNPTVGQMADQRAAAPAPPREKTTEEKVVDALKARYAVGERTRGGLEIVSNTSSVSEGSVKVKISIVAKRADGRIAEIVPVPPRQLALDDSMFQSLVRNAAAQELRGVMAGVADRAARRSNKQGWQIRLVATITTYRDGRVTVKVKKESGEIPDDPATEQGAIDGAKSALKRIAWPIDDRTSSQTFELPVVIVPPSE